MKYNFIKKRKKKIKKTRILSVKEIQDLRNDKVSIKFKKRFYKDFKKEYVKQKCVFKLHGLTLVRFLMHKHPTIKPFNLNKVMISYVSSSINVIDSRLLFDIAYSFIPDFPYESRHLSSELSKKIKSMFNVIFPTKEYVQNSTLGPQNANCIFLDYDRYYSRKFEKTVMAKFEGNKNIKNNDQVIPHLKVCIVSNDKGKINDDTIIYIGSHNMTKAAWGRYNKMGTMLYVSNYEMGIIIPPKLNSMRMKKDIIKKLGFVYPAKKYTKNGN